MDCLITTKFSKGDLLLSHLLLESLDLCFGSSSAVLDLASMLDFSFLFLLLGLAG